MRDAHTYGWKRAKDLVPGDFTGKAKVLTKPVRDRSHSGFVTWKAEEGGRTVTMVHPADDWVGLGEELAPPPPKE